MSKSDWPVVRLGDLIEIRHGYAFAGEFFRDEPPGDILLTPGNFAIGGGFKGDKFKYYVGQVPEDYVLEAGDLLITMTDLSKAGDSLGYPAIVPKSIRVRYLHNQRLGKVLFLPGTAIAKEFLHYLLRSKAYRNEVLASATGSTVKHTSPERIKAFTFRLPPLAEQRAIAHTLGTLDDKIELNRRMNETLEATARAIFKSWFVDFDPIRAKMEGRWKRGESLPGLPAHLYDFFPNRLVDSELGEIPEGWRVASLQELAAIQGGKQLPTEECKPFGTFPVFGANGIMGYAERTTHEEFVIAFGRVGAYCGSVCWTYSGAWINNNASSVVPRRWPEFVLQSMLRADFGGLRTGSAQPFIPNSSLASLQVVRPPEEVLDTFCSVVRPLRLKQQGSQNESRTLAAIRDALLPKLISGEIRVKDAEKLAGRAS
jgi:type I restriction enzyme S subunit